ncbi:MAG TPA: hypothetical protein VHY22_15385 [Chthoniobacteraceae bacterium]|jgi:GNAT superfamily N-acetyltransferase|nr:hypothetical protein [Chthoniobacteraceae bacterium]
MVIHELDAQPAPELQRALDEFDASFRAPFAAGRTFHMRYGKDRTAFGRTLGESRCFAAEHLGRVLGFMEMSVVELLLPGGETRPAVYFPTIKVLPEARGSLVAGRLIQQAMEWSSPKAQIGFSVALEGTPVTPPIYTGRAGIPEFREAARTALVRVPLPPGDGMLPEDGPFIVARERGEAIFRQLVRGRYAVLGGSPEARSISKPVWMAHPGGLACARMEDRRKVKQLVTDAGRELLPAYLSCFAFQDARAAVALLVAALRRAKTLGFGAVRICIAPAEMALLEEVAGAGTIEQGGAVIYATPNVITGEPWTLNAAEI